MIKHCGPIDVLIDDQAETVTFEVKRIGKTSTHVSDGTMRNVASWALSVANETGYTVDQTPLMPFFTGDDSE